MRVIKFLIIIAAFLLAGCATTRKVQDLETKVGILEGRISTIEQRQVIVESQTTESRVENISGSSVVAAGKMSKKDIQVALKNANFYDGPIDGAIGKETRKAIKEFQKAIGLKADGIAGKETQEKLAVYLTK